MSTKKPISRVKRVAALVEMIHKKEELPVHKSSEENISSECVCKPYYKTVCFYFTVSIFLISLSGVIILLATELYETAILQILTLQECGVVFGMWKTPEFETTIYVYPFNYTNIENIKSEKPNVVELGPYIFKEKVEKVNVVFNDDGTLTYSENRSHVFDIFSSIGDIDDVFYTPNIPFLAAAAQGAEQGVVSQLGLAALLKGLDTRPFLPVTVADFVDGFDDSFSIVARKLSKFLKGVTPPKFGILADRVGLAPERITIGTGVLDLDNFGVVYSYDGLTKLNYWKTEECNTITGSDGTFFPPRYVQRGSTVHVYIHRFCRRIPLVYNGIMQEINDFPAKRFELPPNVFSTPQENQDNACFYYEEKCQPSGTFSTSKCNFGAPLAVSFPHFLHGDEELRTNVTGLYPDPEKHGFYMDLHSEFGLPMGGRMRFQLNVDVHHCPFLSQLNAIPHRTILPIAWVDFSIGQVKGYGKDIIYHATYTMSYIKQATVGTLIIITLLAFVFLCKILINK